MSATNEPRKVLLAAIDDSPIAKLVLAEAASIARTTPGAELHLVHVPRRYADAAAGAATFELEDARRQLDGFARDARAASGVTVVAHLVEREPGDAILRTAASIDADLVVVGTGDKRLAERWLLGSVAQHVMQHATCPVLVVRPKTHAEPRAPEVEPPCADCLKVQRASGGAKLWCARHSEKHPRAHLHYEASESFDTGWNLLRPE